MAISTSIRQRTKRRYSLFCSKHGKLSWIAALILLPWLGSGFINSAFAQSADEHSAHHPSPPAAATSASPPAAKAGTAPASAGAASGSMGMMGHMGAPPKAFYPWLMDLPQLTPEARQFIEDEAKRRLSAGSDAIGTGQAGLHHAMAANDSTALQAAAAGIREGLQTVESGAAALRAPKDGAEPRQIALAWFRGQTGLDTHNVEPTPGPFGWSWFHLIAMLFLGAFVLGTLLIHFARMRRISELTARLAAQPGDAAVLVPVLPPIAPSVAVAATGVSAPLPSMATPSIVADKAAPPIARASRWSGPLRVAAIFRETHDVKSFRMVNPDGGVIPFTYLPGQFLTFSVDIDGKRVRRSYTIASSPAVTAYVDVTVKRQEHHGASAFLHDRVKAGDLLDIAAATGHFTFTGEEDSIVLIAGGVGITPMMSLIRYLTDVSFPGEIFLLYGARSTEDFIFREELEYLQRRHEHLHIAATMARAAGTAWMGPEGPITKDFIKQAVPEITRRHIHLCGPPPMMDAVKAELVELGVPRERIETEAFGPAEGMVPHDALETDILEVKGAPIPDAATEVAPAQVRFSVSKKTGPLRPDQSVLEAAEAIGVEIDYSCRVGTCGVCRVRLLEGAVTMAVEEGLQPGDKERGIILACQAKSAGNLVVEA